MPLKNTLRTEGSTVRIEVDRTKCRGTGLCEHICPQVFRVVDGLCTVVVKNISPAAQACCREAAANCPNQAIRMKV